MSKKAIALVADHAWLKEYDEGLTQLARETVDQIEFLKRRAEQAADAAQTEKQARWEALREKLVETGLLPAEYSTERGDYLSLRDGVLIYHEGGKEELSPLDQFLAQILGKGR